ncbi:hypothetical protein CWI37_1647p0020 [Hamiltosporidium tvaerminnensis]|uniref:Uncharacterized protein n=1 Tax=Hamiltosporidium tvaerminnensis TaxID=1176355 RepID=A0A4Q9KUX9_9MICR|nr:hypothetical protein CWI37_1647p0020 [Hamiltosporidium tvaerminnensis]
MITTSQIPASKSDKNPINGRVGSPYLVIVCYIEYYSRMKPKLASPRLCRIPTYSTLFEPNKHIDKIYLEDLHRVQLNSAMSYQQV